MTESNSRDNEFQFDQPWNPVSYFEEESEAAGGMDVHGTAYSPSKLTSLFETSILPNEEEIYKNKLVHPEQSIKTSCSNSNIKTDDKNRTEQFTLETDDGLKVLESMYEINKKNIFNDFDKLKNWQETLDKPNKETSLNEEDTEENISYLMSPHIGNESKLILNNENNSKESPGCSNNTAPERLIELERRLSESNLVLPNELDTVDETDPLTNQSKHSEAQTSHNSTCNNEQNKNATINDLLDLRSIENDSILPSTIDPLSPYPTTNDDIQVLNQSNVSKDIAMLLDLDTVKAVNSSETTDIDNLLNFTENLISNENLTSNKSTQCENETDNNSNDSELATSSSLSINLLDEIEDGNTKTTEDENDGTSNIGVIGFSNNLDDIPNEELDYLLDNLEEEFENEISLGVISESNNNSISENVQEAKSESALSDTILSSIASANKSDTLLEADNCEDDPRSAIETEMALPSSMENIPQSENSPIVNNDSVTKNDNENAVEKSSDIDANDSCEAAKETEFSEISNKTEDIKALNENKDSSLENNAASQEGSLEDLTHFLASTNIDSNVSNDDTVHLEKYADSTETIPSVVDGSAEVDVDSTSNGTQELDNAVAEEFISNFDNTEMKIDSINDINSTDFVEASERDSDNQDLVSVGVHGDVFPGSDEVFVSSNNNQESLESPIDVPTALETTNDEVGELPTSGILNVENNKLEPLNRTEFPDEETNTITERNLNNETEDLEIPEEQIQPPSSQAIAFEGSEEVPAEINANAQAETETETADQASAAASSSGNHENIEDIPRLERSSSVTRRVRFDLPRNDGLDNVSINSQDSLTSNPPLLPPRLSDRVITGNITDNMRRLGWYAPKWIPDIDARSCMNCDLKFTVVKRRHHCRACGKVLCSQCCNMRFSLPYLNYKQVRVCQMCCDTMLTVSNAESNSNFNRQPVQTPFSPLGATGLPEAPPPYSERVENHEQRLSSISSDAPPYTEAARFSEQPAPILPAGQAIESLPNTRPPNFPPGSPINDLMSFHGINTSLPSYSASSTPTTSSGSTRQRPRNRTESEMSAVIMFNSAVTNLPPVLRNSNDETRIVNNPNLQTLFQQINDENEDPVSFIVNKNLVVRVKTVNMDCCVEKKCWCFVSDGMGASNQEEVVIIIKCDSHDLDDVTLTKKVLTQLNYIFEKAKHGHPVSDLEHTEFDSSMTCLPKNVGMLFFKLTLQCTKKLFLPTSPYLFGLYIERSEVPWAKNFPLRLLLRIGAQFKYYPCPLFNVLDRAPVYDGVGRTILDLLADFQNFQYTIARVNGVTINLRGKDTIINLPQHRYDEVMKVINACEDNVLSLAGNFSSTCDGHLVSVEKDGRYKTQTLSIVLKENRKVTCASFIVISAALKPSQEGIKAKASIVEDGVMVQVTASVMKEIKSAIKEMKSYSVVAGDPNSEEASKVGIEWSSTEISDRPRLESPIDGTSFNNLTNMKIRHSYDYTSNSLTAKIHWVEVYFLPQDNDTVQRLSARELGQMTSSIAKACMSALSPHLMVLIGLNMLRIGLRVNLASDFVEYKIGSNLSTLPAELLPTLDDKLVPAIHSVMTNAQERVAVELIFQVVKIV